MTFGQALEIIKSGGKVARSGWNGRNMHLQLSTFVQDDRNGWQPCIVMRTNHLGERCLRQPGWLASQADMLADDWVEV